MFQIKKGQNPDGSRMKDTSSIFNALEIYDIHDVYTEVESLQERGLKPVDLILPVKEIYRKDTSGLMNQYDIVFGN